MTPVQLHGVWFVGSQFERNESGSDRPSLTRCRRSPSELRESAGGLIRVKMMNKKMGTIFFILFFVFLFWVW